jgi:transposase
VRRAVHRDSVFIRRTKTRNAKTGEEYYTHRLVENVRVGVAVKQRTLLNLGANFDLPQGGWSALTARMDALLHGQDSLLVASPVVEALAQRYVARLIASPERQAPDDVRGRSDFPKRYQEVDLDSLEFVRPRTVGVEHAALTAVRWFGLEDKLAEVGLNRPQIAAALGNIIGRMAVPGSELATFEWLQRRTALGELIRYDYEGLDLNQLYRSADLLLKHRAALETHIFGTARSLFDIQETITLYDLTNTYFEGQAAGISQAKRGRSKEKRSDCPLVTLALVLDASGFPKRSRVFAGNIGEAGTLQGMLADLAAPAGAVVVMDAGIASEENLTWLTAQGHRYIVVSRKQTRSFDSDKAIAVATSSGEPVQIHRAEGDNGEVLLYCYSPMRAEKDRAIDSKKANFFEVELQKLADGLTKPRATKDPAKIHQRIGRARQKYARAAQHYTVELTLDEAGKAVTAITWTKAPKANSSMANPGIYCLRTTLTEPDDATLWRIYSMLTNLEAVFRSLKTDLGLRPVHHRIDRRVEGHLLISLIAYCFVHAIRMRLKDAGINDSWDTIRNSLSNQVRITTTLKRRDGSTVHVRKASRPEPHQQLIYDALKLSPNPGGTLQPTIG